jgi:hypothetical protein
MVGIVHSLKLELAKLETHLAALELSLLADPKDGKLRGEVDKTNELIRQYKRMIAEGKDKGPRWR